MTALVEKMVQRFTEATPIEAKVSRFVAGVIENTASKLARFEPGPQAAKRDAV
jgi:hypothetical protein